MGGNKGQKLKDLKLERISIETDKTPVLSMKGKKKKV